MSWLSEHASSLVLAGIFSALILYQIYENRSLRRIDSTFSLKRFAWWRTTQLIFIFFAAIITLSHQQQALVRAKFDLARLESSQMQVDDILAAINPPQNTTEDIALDKPNKESDKTPPKNQNPIADMYDPSQYKDDKQSKLNVIKSRYEEVLVTHFFLRKCQIAPSSDYHIIMSALAVEMASANAPGRLQYDILTAAKGSFKEMYAKSSCDERTTQSLRESYANYINAISKNVITP